VLQCALQYVLPRVLQRVTVAGTSTHVLQRVLQFVLQRMTVAVASMRVL